MPDERDSGDPTPSDIAKNIRIVTLKWGKRYGSAEVNRLYRGSKKHGLAGCSFYCFTDDPRGLDNGIIAMDLPKIDLPEKYRWTFWRKICLFSNDFPVSGPCLYFDIDCVIVGPLRPLLSGWNGEPRLAKTFAGPKTIRRGGHDGINSSLMLYRAGGHTNVAKRFHENKESILTIYPGDQGFIYNCLKNECGYFSQRHVVSFKKHCIPKFPLNLIFPPAPPKGAAVAVFHGRPDPEEARLGYRTRRMKHACRPTSWITDTSS